MDKDRPIVLIRADAGREIGFGHLVRTAALAGILRNRFDCRVACRCDAPEGEAFIQSNLQQAGATLFKVENSDKLIKTMNPDNLFKIENSDNLAFEEYNEEFLRLIPENSIVVLDHYGLDNEYRRRIRSKAKALVCIDDIAGQRFDCDILFSPSPIERERFDIADDTLYYGGPSWAFLRRPFLTAPERSRHDSIKSLMIAMGGSDPEHLSEKLAGIMRELLPDCNTRVIAGPGTDRDYLENLGVSVVRNLDAEGMARLMIESDMGIFPASGVCIEAMAVGLPVAAGYYVDNQSEIYTTGVKEGWFADLGDLRDDPDMLRRRLGNVIINYDPTRVPDFDFKTRQKEIIEIFERLWKRKS